LRRAAAIAALLLASACGKPPAPPPGPPAAPAQAEPAQRPPAPSVAAPKLPPPKTPLEAYKRDLAQRILSANATQTFDGRPPDILRAVIVLQLTLDRNGKVAALKTLRSRHPAQEKVAIASVRAAGPLPAPPASLLRRGTLEVAETWLFRDDGTFQLRSLAEAQAPDIGQ
jgi:protein TonB